MRLTGKVAVVTGGATGIGLASAMAFAREGADVAINYSKNVEAATRAVKAIEAQGRRAIALRADVSRDAEAHAMIAEAAAKLGGVDVLLNSAGWTRKVSHADLDGLTDEIWDRAWAINVKAPFYCARAAAPLMRARGGGAIVNVTSQAAISATGSSIAYAAAKAALATATMALARALAPDIRVNAVAPGLIPTGFGGFTERDWSEFAVRTPIGRLATADEVADTILYLVTNGAITGQSIVVDGGLLALGPRAAR